MNGNPLAVDAAPAPNLLLRNVLESWRQQQGQMLNLMRAAWKLTAPEKCEKRLDQLERFLQSDHHCCGLAT